MTGLEGSPHLVEPVTALAGEVDLAQLLKQLPSGHFSSAIRPAEIGDTLGMPYSHEGTHGLEPAAWAPGSKVAANCTEDTEDGQLVANHHDCNLLGKQSPFARRHGHNVAPVSVRTKDHTIEKIPFQCALRA